LKNMCFGRHNLLEFGDRQVLVHQLQRSLGRVNGSLVTISMLLIFLIWAMPNPAYATNLHWWCLAAFLSKLNCWRHARQTLKRGIDEYQSTKITWTLVVLNALDGALWGSLLWITLDNTTLVRSALVIAVMTGVGANAMSVLASVPLVFIAFVSSGALVALSKLLLIQDSAFTVLVVAGLLNLFFLIGLALRNGTAARQSIRLRLDNAALLEKLRLKTHLAEDARRTAEQANQAKSKFLAAASHDLRQPVHAQGLVLNVLSRTALTAHQRDLLASANVSGATLANMLDDLLDFSKIEAGVIEPQVQTVRLQPLLNKIEREFAGQADAAGLNYRSRETDLMVQSDPALLERIMRNLVSNAIRYTPQGGILVACRKRGEKAVLEVWDTGLGIAPSQQGDIFREFHQLGNPERDHRKGLGLGLSIVDGIALKLGHHLSLSSVEGRGSVFRLTLPLSQKAAPSTATTLPVDCPIESLNLHVLVIDDDERVLAAMAQLLADWGCKCDVAESAHEAMTLARASMPEVIISDYRLRGHQTGLQAIESLRQMAGVQVPALLVTGDTLPARLRDTHTSNIPTLHKPVAPEVLYKRLKSLLP
jgi:signal transduction histidine kinase